MPAQNSNIHIVYDGEEWAIAVEGKGRLDHRFDSTRALAIATALAAERRAILYIHDKQGGIVDRVDFSEAPSMPAENIGTKASQGTAALPLTACDSLR